MPTYELDWEEIKTSVMDEWARWYTDNEGVRKFAPPLVPVVGITKIKASCEREAIGFMKACGVDLDDEDKTLSDSRIRILAIKEV